MLTGNSTAYGYTSKIYRNNITTTNENPAAPTGLLANVSGTGVTLSWNKSTDSKTPQQGISYNLYIGNSAGSVNKKSPMSSLSDGYRKISAKGLIQKNSWSVKKLPV